MARFDCIREFRHVEPRSVKDSRAADSLTSLKFGSSQYFRNFEVIMAGPKSIFPSGTEFVQSTQPNQNLDHAQSRTRGRSATRAGFEPPRPSFWRGRNDSKVSTLTSLIPLADGTKLFLTAQQTRPAGRNSRSRQSHPDDHSSDPSCKVQHDVGAGKPIFGHRVPRPETSAAKSELERPTRISGQLIPQKDVLRTLPGLEAFAKHVCASIRSSPGSAMPKVTVLRRSPAGVVKAYRRRRSRGELVKHVQLEPFRASPVKFSARRLKSSLGARSSKRTELPRFEPSPPTNSVTRSSRGADAAGGESMFKDPRSGLANPGQSSCSTGHSPLKCSASSRSVPADLDRESSPYPNRLRMMNSCSSGTPGYGRPSFPRRCPGHSEHLLYRLTHCCPVKSRIESIGWGHRGIRFGSRMAGVPVKWAFFRIA